MSIINITCPEAFERIQQFENTIMVDVRTEKEWIEIGFPQLNNDAQLIKLSWKILPNWTINLDFLKVIESLVKDKERELLFLCRSGGRSLEAAQAVSDIGFKNCYNIIDGFEGSAQGAGWKNNLLPYKFLK
jgi:rhodanese-related sulfurtransferase